MKEQEVNELRFEVKKMEQRNENLDIRVLLEYDS